MNLSNQARLCSVNIPGRGGFLGRQQVPQITAGPAIGGTLLPGPVERFVAVGEFRTAQIVLAFIGEDRAVTGQACGKNAVKHVNAPRHRFDDPDGIPEAQ